MCFLLNSKTFFEIAVMVKIQFRYNVYRDQPLLFHGKYIQKILYFHGQPHFTSLFTFFLLCAYPASLGFVVRLRVKFIQFKHLKFKLPLKIIVILQGYIKLGGPPNISLIYVIENYFCYYLCIISFLAMLEISNFVLILINIFLISSNYNNNFHSDSTSSSFFAILDASPGT